VILLELGYNDLAFGVSDPNGLLDDLQSVIAGARAASPDVSVLVGNLVHRDPAVEGSNVASEISTYDSELPGELSSLSTPDSPLFTVDLASAYHAPQDTWDGLHPNSFGEFALAGAFASALSSDEGIGRPIPSSAIPAKVYTPAVAVPSGLAAAPAANHGVTLSWKHVFGASSYNLYSADLTLHQSLTLESQVGTDGVTLSGLAAGHTYQYAVSAAFGTLSSSARSGAVTVAVSP
jgi:hypothetical protein